MNIDGITNNSFKTIALRIFFKNLTIQQMFNILWNHLYSWGPVFVDSGFYAYWSRCRFVAASVFRFSKKHNSLWICFSQRCKFMEEGYQLKPRKLNHHGFSLSHSNLVSLVFIDISSCVSIVNDRFNNMEIHGTAFKNV